MKKFYLILLVIAVAKAKENKKPDSKIVGGDPINIIQAPYQVSLHSNGYFTAAGSLISEKFVLTAAHCIIQNSKASQYTVRVGSTYRSYGGKVIGVKAYIRHPGYFIPKRQHDIALLLLEEKVIESATSKFIQLNSRLTPVGTKLFITGWGQMKEGGSISETLMGTYVAAVDQKVCKNALSFQYIIHDTQICAGGNGEDTCSGDSGGPMVNNFKLVGITSFGHGCGRRGFPGVYTRVSKYNEWIYENMVVLNQEK